MQPPMSHPGRVVIDGLRFREMIPGEQIASEIAAMADELVRRHALSNPILLCILNGAAFFHADLVRRMPIPLEVDYLRVASYHGETRSSGRVIFTAEPGTQMAGRNVILVEDIVDSGGTVEFLREYLLQQGAASVDVATLLYKPEAHRIGPRPAFVGFEIPDRFVIGFGLDYRQQGRNLPSIYVLDEDPVVEQGSD
jgi:hypoxanthine phosphoribosyltransferase